LIVIQLLQKIINYRLLVIKDIEMKHYAVQFVCYFPSP